MPGEGRATGAVPAHPNGIRVGRERWLVLYATRCFRGVDDDFSICWQLRRGAPVGEVVREGILARSADDWDALGDGRRWVRQHGHPVAFGVPKGALIGAARRRRGTFRGQVAPGGAPVRRSGRGLVVHQGGPTCGPRWAWSGCSSA